VLLLLYSAAASVQSYYTGRSEQKELSITTPPNTYILGFSFVLLLLFSVAGVQLHCKGSQHGAAKALGLNFSQEGGLACGKKRRRWVMAVPLKCASHKQCVL